MATQRKVKQRTGPSNPKFAKAVKKTMSSRGGQDDAHKAGGDASLGRTLNVKAHPSHPSTKFVAPRGRASGARVPNAAQVGAKKHAMKKADSKSKKTDK